MSLKLRKENQVLPSFESLIGPFTVGVPKKKENDTLQEFMIFLT
jgi:hypothetical protein